MEDLGSCSPPQAKRSVGANLVDPLAPEEFTQEGIVTPPKKNDNNERQAHHNYTLLKLNNALRDLTTPMQNRLAYYQALNIHYENPNLPKVANKASQLHGTAM